MKQYEPIVWDIETTGLNPMVQDWMDGVMYDARVTAVGIGRVHGWREATEIEEAEVEVKSLWDQSEYRLLEVANERMTEIVEEMEEAGKTPFLVGYNSRQFDHQYIGARYGRYRLEGSHINHGLKRLDLQRVVNKHYDHSRYMPSQDEVAEVYGVEVPDEYDGKDMPEAYANGEWAKIQAHVEGDIEVLGKLFVAMRNGSMNEFYQHYNVGSDFMKADPGDIQEEEW